ncbi:MAG: hypothetical protein PVJ73_02315 [Acidobacteriota bacterium]|jgi:hypothetical protein
MRIRALVPTLAVAAALVAPSSLLAEPDHHRARDRGRGPGYDRSSPGHRDSYRSGGRSDRSAYQRGYPRVYRHRRYTPPPRRYLLRSPRAYRYRPYSRPYYGYRPVPPAYYPPHAPYGYPVGPPIHRGGVHGGISIGVPGFGLSLVF